MPEPQLSKRAQRAALLLQVIASAVVLISEMGLGLTLIRYGSDNLIVFVGATLLCVGFIATIAGGAYAMHVWRKI